MDYGLDLIMNQSKAKKKKYNLPNTNQTSLLEVIQETISNELDLKHSIPNKTLENIIKMTIDIYKQNTKIPIEKKIEKTEIRLDYVPGEPRKNINLENFKVKDDKKINVEVNKVN